MTIADPYGVVPAIEAEAQQLGVDPRLAVADAQVESGLNPKAIGDGGHSVGLFQLNDQGEGAGLSVTQREDPTLNARIALTQFAAVAKTHPGLDPGQLAADAQRPADPAGYAQQVDAAYGALSAGELPNATLTGSYTGGIPNPLDPGQLGGALGGVAGSALSGVANTIGGFLLKGVFLAGGVGLVALGAWRAFAPAREQAAPAVAKAAELGAVA